MTETPEPPQQPEPAPPPQAAAPVPAPQAPVPWRPILIGAAVAGLLLVGFFVVQQQLAGRAADEAFTVEPFTPQTELIAGRERAPGYEQPDTASLVAVEFGAGVTLNVTGRVSRGLGNDWYAVAWNDRVVFVRQADAVAGSGAPPSMAVREEEPEEIKLPEEEEEKPDEDVFAEFPPAPDSGGTLSIGEVAWIREPTSRDFARYFPRQALDDGQSGRVTLDCAIAGNGRLDCSVGSESPQGYGFGDAAMNISRQLRVQSRLPDGSPAAGRRMRLPLSFQAG
jgi:TonB family protein